MDLRGDPFIPNFFLNFMLCLAVASCGGSAGPSNQPLLDTSAGAATKPLFNSNPIIIEDAIAGEVFFLIGSKTIQYSLNLCLVGVCLTSIVFLFDVMLSFMPYIFYLIH